MRAALSKNNQKKKNKRTESKFIKSPYQPTNPPCPCPCLPGGGIKSGIKSGMAMADAAFIARGSEWGDGGLVKHLHGLPAPALGAVSYGGS